MSALIQQLDEVHHRIGALAEQFDDADRDDLLDALHEAERLARGAARELTRANRLLQP